jgi:hypothetical protein
MIVGGGSGNKLPGLGDTRIDPVGVVYGNVIDVARGATLRRAPASFASRVANAAVNESMTAAAGAPIECKKPGSHPAASLPPDRDQ